MRQVLQRFVRLGMAPLYCPGWCAGLCGKATHPEDETKHLSVVLCIRETATPWVVRGATSQGRHWAIPGAIILAVCGLTNIVDANEDSGCETLSRTSDGLLVFLCFLGV